MQTHYEPLSDAGWQFIEEILNDKRRRKHNLRLVVDSILKVLRTGTQWRKLELEGICWQCVYYYFWRWKRGGSLERLNAHLNQKEQKQQSESPTLSLFSIDNQFIKSVPFVR